MLPKVDNKTRGCTPAFQNSPTVSKFQIQFNYIGSLLQYNFCRKTTRGCWLSPSLFFMRARKIGFMQQFSMAHANLNDTITSLEPFLSQIKCQGEKRQLRKIFWGKFQRILNEAFLFFCGCCPTTQLDGRTFAHCTIHKCSQKWKVFLIKIQRTKYHSLQRFLKYFIDFYAWKSFTAYFSK